MMGLETVYFARASIEALGTTFPGITRMKLTILPVGEAANGLLGEVDAGVLGIRWLCLKS